MENNKKSMEEMAEEALDGVSGGAGKVEGGWVCSKCGKDLLAPMAKAGKVYCITCYTEEFGSPTA